MKTTVIICTKDRPDDVRTALRSIVMQTAMPDGIVIVDAGMRHIVSGVTHEFPSLPIRHIHVAPPGLTRQRNIGIRESIGDIVLFIDDDVILEPNYVEHVVSVFARDVDGEIGAVLGRVTNFGTPRSTTLQRMTGIAVTLILRVFLLSRPGSGQFQLSGLPTLPHQEDRPRFVDCLSGCAMSFRRKLVADIGFDEHLAGYTEFDDVDVAARLGRRAKIYYEPRARLHHAWSAAARDHESSRQRQLILHHGYVSRKNWPPTIARRAAFWWSVIGICLLHLAARRWDAWAGARTGVMTLIRESLGAGGRQR